MNPFDRHRNSNQSPTNKGEIALGKKLKNMENQTQNNGEGKNRNSKSIIKLPNINSKTVLNKQNTDTTMSDSSPANQNSLKGLSGKTVSNTEKKIFSNEVE